MEPLTHSTLRLAAGAERACLLCADVACRAFLHAVLCGFSTPEGRVHVNPAESDVPPADSRLILLGRGGELNSTRS